jgi:hypothetical protein
MRPPWVRSDLSPQFFLPSTAPRPQVLTMPAGPADPMYAPDRPARVRPDAHRGRIQARRGSRVPGRSR